MTIATIKKEIKDLKNALNTNLDEKFKVKLREQLSKSEKTLAEMESAKTPTAKKTATKKANVVAKKSTSVLQKIKQANKKAEPKKSTPAKKSTAKQPSALQKIKNQVKLNKNLSGYKKSGIDLLRDGNRPALPAGKRISKDGNVYYENRLNRVDVRQPSKKVAKPNKLEEGGMMAKGGKVELIVHGKSRQYSMGTFDSIASLKRYVKETDMKQPYTIKKLEDGGMMAKGGQVSGYFTFRPYVLENGFYKSTTLSSVSPDNVMRKGLEGKLKGNDFNSAEYVADAIMQEFQNIAKLDIVKRGATLLKSKVVATLERSDSDKNEYSVKYMADGGMMAKGGFVSKGEMVWGKLSGSERMKFLNENFTPSITPRSQEILVDKTFVFLPKEVKIKLEEKFANVEPNEDGKYMEIGGRLKSALMRDRAYKSNEPHEQAYTRKTRPKNPKYNYGFFEDGGSTEMHRAYAMGGVLQHGLESGDFIVSHDEGKMVVMNGGSKYEVNIHSGSRTKID
jgi:hypothetical protein